MYEENNKPKKKTDNKTQEELEEETERGIMEETTEFAIENLEIIEPEDNIRLGGNTREREYLDIFSDTGIETENEENNPDYI